MASEEYEQILEVQAHDLKLRQLRHHHANHPVRAAVQEASEEANNLTTEIGDLQTSVDKNKRDLRQLESEVSMLEAKRKAINDKLYGGQVSATKEMLALQAEDETNKAKQDELDDQQLLLLDEIESMEGHHEELVARQAEVTTRLAAAEADLATQLSLVDVEMGDETEQRHVAAGAANKELLAVYESMRDGFDGVAVARLRDGHCDGCHMQLSAVVVDRLSTVGSGETISCEECGRLLVR